MIMSNSPARRRPASIERSSILDLLESSLDKRGPSHRAFDFSGATLTLGQLDAESLALATALSQLAVRAGDTVATLLDNGPEQLLMLFACSKLGAVHVPVNTAYKGQVLCHQLADAGAAVIVTDTAYFDRICKVREALPNLAHIVHVGLPPEQSAGSIHLHSFATLLKAGTGLVPVKCKPEELAILIYTSGTTGPSKGCMISHNYICNMARQVIEFHGLREDDVIWTPLPGFHVNHIATTLLSSLMLGARASIYPRFSLSGFWSEIERSGATVASIIASMITQVADAADSEAVARCFGQLRVVIGVPFPQPVIDKWRARFGIKFGGSAGYGMTECAAITSARIDAERPPGSSGRRNDDFDVRIFDEEDNELPAGVAGEIVVRPCRPHVMFEGYWRNSEATARQMRNLWFHTGDIGKFDETGYFYFVDRKKDYLRRRGENISSCDLESILRRHEALLEVAVHAVPSDQGEDDVKLTAVLKPGVELTEESLCRWCIEEFPYFAVPRYIEFRSELPKNPVGRILKFQLRDEGVTPSTWDRARSSVVVTRR
jgi:crotonobetaine/carnitine-CoA ligase